MQIYKAPAVSLHCKHVIKSGKQNRPACILQNFSILAGLVNTRYTNIMMKKITLFLVLSAVCFVPAFSQVAVTPHHHEHENDSLEGFNPDSVMAIAFAAHLEPWEAAMFLSRSKQLYKVKKYDLNGYNERGNGLIGTVTPQTACSNMGFETGDYSAWQGAIGDNNLNSLGPLQNIQVGIYNGAVDPPVTDNTARHNIMTAAAGNDPCGGFPIVPANYGQYVARLGNTYANYQGEILEQTFVVDANTTQFTYRYAVVLNDGGHLTGEQPYFRIELLDSVGNPVSPCAQYYVEAGGSVPGFVACPSDPYTYYKPWSTITIDLQNYINHSVTVRFTVAGCIYGGHYGYAYIDCACGNIGDAVSATFCPGSPGAFLVAPTGFATYQWYDPSGNIINGANNDSLFVTGANPGDTFSVNMSAIADTTCHTVLSVVVNYTYLQTTHSGIDPLCFGDANGSATVGCSNCIPPTQYTWNTSPVQTGTTATNLPAGTYIVSIQDSIGCQEADTVTLVDPPRLDTSGITTQFCVGDPQITLIAVSGQPSYTWFDQAGTQIGTGQTYVLVSPVLGSIYYCVYGTTPCPITDSIIINYVPPLNLFMPDTTVNVFTPNGDMRNDYFYPYFDNSVVNQTALGTSTPQYDFYELYVGTFEIRVWDRWGVEVFYSNDYTVGWDGKFNGKEAQQGVYYWETKFTSRCKEDMEPIINTGFVHLIR